MRLLDSIHLEFGSFIVTSARGSDVFDLAALDLVAQPSPWTAEVFERELEISKSRTWVVRDLSGELCAYLVFWLVVDEVHIMNVVTHPDARRQGIAQTLIARLASLAQESRCSMMTLEVRASNIPAQRLYEGLDFRQIGRRPKYYRDNQEDALILARILDEDEDSV